MFQKRFFIFIIFFTWFHSSFSNNKLNENKESRSFFIEDSLIFQILTSSHSVNHFLSQLKNNVGTRYFLEENFIPVWSSSSLQKSQPHCPRMLMYNKTGTLILSVVDCKEHREKGGNDIEIVQWNSREKTYDLWSVNYPPSEETVINPSSNLLANPHISSKNPQKCMSCHTGGIAIGVYDPFSFPNSEVGWWLKMLNQFYRKKNKLKRYSFFNFKAHLEGYHDKVGNFPLETPLSRFNFLIAPNNHVRTIHGMKIFLDKARKEAFQEERIPIYDELKYAILAALSDCSNYSHMISKKSFNETPYTEEKIKEKVREKGESRLFPKEKRAFRLHNHIHKRIGSHRVLRSSNHPINTFEEKFYSYTQALAVKNIYYVFLYYTSSSSEAWTHLTTPSYEKNLMGVEKALLLINLNPIKMSWHRAWSAAEIANKMIESDPELQELKTMPSKSDWTVLDYLKIKSGLIPKNKNISLWKKVSQIPSDDFDEKQKILQKEEDVFKHHCSKIHSLYQKACEKNKDFFCYKYQKSL